MKKRLLGKTGIRISEIAFGCVEIGMPYGIGVNSREDMLSNQEAVRLLQTAVDEGINFFDTARMYGESERIMGEAFRGKRHKVIIATKCSHFLDKDGRIPPLRDLKVIIRKSLDESLKALKTDYADIFMLHQGSIGSLNSDDITGIFENLKKEGKIRVAGVSTYTAEETSLAIGKSWGVVQLPFNLMDQRQKELFPLANEKGTGLVIRSVLLKGLLSNRGKNLHPALADVERHLTRYEELLKGKVYPLSALAIKYVLSFLDVSAALVGIDSLAYLHRSIEAANGQYLDDAGMELAEKLAYPDPDFINLPYWDKMNWLK
ncbi:MAG: aldo/keto reductase [Bacteroidales bacterium]|jgi:aryl-alcohol dehydrogenase-like predicted oxidoreductase|nr:aldo/keto reductase [Bacteroidales bacterium]